MTSKKSQHFLSLFRSINLTIAKAAVKAGPGRLQTLHIFNAAGAARYVKAYDALLADVVVGTTVPVMTIPIAAGGTVILAWDCADGIDFATGITLAAVTGLADNSVADVTANDVIVNATYK